MKSSAPEFGYPLQEHRERALGAAFYRHVRHDGGGPSRCGTQLSSTIPTSTLLPVLRPVRTNG